MTNFHIFFSIPWFEHESFRMRTSEFVQLWRIFLFSSFSLIFLRFPINSFIHLLSKMKANEDNKAITSKDSMRCEAFDETSGSGICLLQYNIQAIIFDVKRRCLIRTTHFDSKQNERKIKPRVTLSDSQRPSELRINKNLVDQPINKSTHSIFSQKQKRPNVMRKTKRQIITQSDFVKSFHDLNANEQSKRKKNENWFYF